MSTSTSIERQIEEFQHRNRVLHAFLEEKRVGFNHLTVYSVNPADMLYMLKEHNEYLENTVMRLFKRERSFLPLSGIWAPCTSPVPSFE